MKCRNCGIECRPEKYKQTDIGGGVYVGGFIMPPHPLCDHCEASIKTRKKALENAEIRNEFAEWYEKEIKKYESQNVARVDFGAIVANFIQDKGYRKF